MANNKKFVVKNGLVAPNAESVLVGNTSLDSLLNTTYSNAVSYADGVGNTAYSNAIAYADAVGNSAYSNAVLYVDTELSNLINSAPGVLDTLNELAAAINDDENFAVTVTNNINTAYSNAVSEATDLANNAYSNAVTYSDTTKVAKSNNTGSAEIPSGTEAERDGSPSAGYFRFNTDTTQFEGYNGSGWGSIGGGATGGGSDQVFIENDQTVTTNYEITSGRNAFTTGPLEIDDGVTVTIPTGSRWIVI